jgi:hypothetical protein
MEQGRSMGITAPPRANSLFRRVNKLAGDG